jgi:Flp pilus assembly pilin Flp
MRAGSITASFVHDERGMETVEYAVMATLVIGGTLVAIGLMLAAFVGRTQELAALVSGG